MSKKLTFLLCWWLPACHPSAWEAKAEFEASLGYKVTLCKKQRQNETVEGAGELARGLGVHPVLAEGPAQFPAPVSGSSRLIPALGSLTCSFGKCRPYTQVHIATVT